jgi:hypothetical protein
MREVNYNSALSPVSFLPFLFLGSPDFLDKPEINVSNITIPVSIKYRANSNGYDVFQSLTSRNIQIEVSQKDILLGFISKISTESKDLEGEIVAMVNRKFEKLLLKL